MTEDYLTGRRLGAKWTDDLCVIKYAEQGEIANSCSTAVGCVGMLPPSALVPVSKHWSCHNCPIVPLEIL